MVHLGTKRAQARPKAKWPGPRPVFTSISGPNCACGRWRNRRNVPKQIGGSAVLFYDTFWVLMHNAVASGTAENAKKKLASVLCCFRVRQTSLEPQIPSSGGWRHSLVLTGTSRVCCRTHQTGLQGYPPPAAYTERPIRVAWNTSKGWRGVPYPPAPPRRRSLGPPSGGPPHTGLTAHVWWTPYAAVGVTIRIVLSLVGVCLYSSHPRVPVPPTGKSLRSFAAPSASSRISAEILANAPIFPWGPRLSPTVA